MPELHIYESNLNRILIMDYNVVKLNMLSSVMRILVNSKEGVEASTAYLLYWSTS